MSENTFACLAGDGVGPELMAAATRALDRVAHLHSLELADVHLPFAGEAMTRSGHPLPPETRNAYREVDAISSRRATSRHSRASRPICTWPGASRACSSASAPTSP
jgi:isocitrate/isopropylmalate dehydrogenase